MTLKTSSVDAAGYSRQVRRVWSVPPLSLVQPLVKEGAEHVDSLCIFFFQFL